MSQLLCNAVLAAPLLAGSGLRWLLVIVVVLGVVVTFALVRSGRKPSPKQDPPMTRPRLTDPDDD